MRFFLLFTLLSLANISFGQAEKVSIVEDENGFRLQVANSDFMINGMNWDYFPIGTNYEYNIWSQPEATIKAALNYEMGLLQQMNVNAIRVYTGIPPKWISYIHENFGIYTMLNHSFGRYGLMINGNWVAQTNYADPTTQDILLSEVLEIAKEYKNTPGLLLYLLGNENNYGLFWAGAETEDFPSEKDKIKKVGEQQGRPMYRLMNEAAIQMKAINDNLPIAICNGDLLYLDIIAEECPDVDIFGTNIYRGESFGDTYERVKNEYGKPVLFTEFGSDAFNAITQQEDQEAQAHYLICNWKEIYQNAAGLGKANNSLGGFTFQFSDGWWKHLQTKNLDVHDTHAAWANGGYKFDYQHGKNNMNEEWFGICAKGPTNELGVYELYPRKAYYVLQDIHRLEVYSSEVDVDYIEEFFNEIKNSDRYQTEGKKTIITK